MKKVATRLRGDLDGFNGRADLYKVSPPHKGHEYIIASATSFISVETCLFPANEKGDILSWMEMEDPLKNILSHEECFKSIGYEVVEDVVRDS